MQAKIHNAAVHGRACMSSVGADGREYQTILFLLLARNLTVDAGSHCCAVSLVAVTPASLLMELDTVLAAAGANQRRGESVRVGDLEDCAQGPIDDHDRAAGPWMRPLAMGTTWYKRTCD